MSHAVESMAYSGQVPWHGLGTSVPDNLSVAKMLKAAQLDWTVSKRALSFATQDGMAIENTVPGFFALTRDSDSKVLDVVGPQYTPTQNKDAFEFFTEFVEAGSAKMETMGSLHGGRITWGLASLQSSFKLKGNDEVKGYMLLISPHQQGKALMGFTTSVRVVCNNTLQAALSGGKSNKFTFRHTREFGKDEQEEAKKTMGIAREQFDSLETICKKLQAIKLSDADCLKMVQQVLGTPTEDLIDDAEKLTTKEQTIYTAIMNSPGAELPSAKGTGWGFVNGFTYAIDHQLRKSQDRRLREAWLGRGASLKQAAVDAVLTLAA